MKSSNIQRQSRNFGGLRFHLGRFLNEMKRRIAAEYPLSDFFLCVCLILLIGYLGFITQRFSLIRFFDFDEFQILYASAALIRGKALYVEKITIHFPLVPILISFIVKIFGFTTFTILIVRQFIFLFLIVTLVFVFKIAKMLWNKTAGLFAVALCLSSLVFVNKGIEIRHDVFNMAFNTAGVFWIIKYLKKRDYLSLCLSGFFLGLSIASTQKAFMWSGGIIIGTSIYLFRENSLRQLSKLLMLYVGFIIIPLLLSAGYLLLISDENLKAFVNGSMVDISDYLHPKKVNAIYPFPYRKIVFR